MSATPFAVIAMLASCLTLGMVAGVVIPGQPPPHCRYFVPVVGKPGIYSCSEHARPVKFRP